MSTVAWILLGVTAWVVVGIAVALLVGRIVRYRDRQVPDDVHRNPADSVPEPRDGSERPSVRSFEGPATTGRGGSQPPN